MKVTVESFVHGFGVSLADGFEAFMRSGVFLGRGAFFLEGARFLGRCGVCAQVALFDDGGVLHADAETSAVPVPEPFLEAFGVDVVEVPFVDAFAVNVNALPSVGALVLNADAETSAVPVRTYPHHPRNRGTGSQRPQGPLIENMFLFFETAARPPLFICFNFCFFVSESLFEQT